MDRLSDLESLRRSIAMLNPRTPDALSREEAMDILRARRSSGNCGRYERI
jgi:hypothetical protein